MHELRLCDWVENDFAEARHFHPHGFPVELRANRILHPAVCNQDPQCGKVRSQCQQNRGHQVLDLAQTIPAEEEQADERRFKEERHEPFECERCTENVANVVRVVGPVRAELEFHRDAGRNAEGEVDAEQFAPEARHVFPDHATCHHVNGFHDHHEPTKAQCERHENEVIHDRHGKLHP